jgi:DNA-binding transcriptional LysR family regulator
VKYRGVAVADTARERPVLTVQLLDKQPRLTVTSLEDKRQALLAGLGVATMPYPFVEKDIAEGRLRCEPGVHQRSGYYYGVASRQHGRSQIVVPARNTQTLCPPQ